jgi:hypothetical protein
MKLNTLELLFLLSRAHKLVDSKRVSWNKVLHAFYKSLCCHSLHTNFYTPQAYSDVGHCQFMTHWCSLSYTGSRNARSIVAMETGLHVEGHRLIRNTRTNYSVRRIRETQTCGHSYVSTHVFLASPSNSLVYKTKISDAKKLLQSNCIASTKDRHCVFTAFRYLFNLT